MKYSPDSPTLALAVGALGSAAANVAWTWPYGAVRIAGGLFATLLVPTALHLWVKVPVTGWITRGLRALVMSGVCGLAAYVNLRHAVLLLVSRGEEAPLAIALTVALELLMVMASLARRDRPAAAGVESRMSDAGQDAGRTVEGGRPAVAVSGEAATVSEGELRAVQQTTPSGAVLASDAGQGQDTAVQDAARGAQMDDQDAQDEASKTETDPVRWAAAELQAGRSAGNVVLRRQFPDLSERRAREIARDARDAQDAGLHVVRTGQDRTG